MEELEEQGKEIFAQNGVQVHTHNVDRDVDSFWSGSLSIVEYSYGKCIEWKPTEEKAVSVEPEQEWAVVNTTVGYKTQNPETVEGIQGISRKPRPLKIDLTDLKSFKLSKNGHQMKLMQKDGTSHSAFMFQHNNAHCFVNALREFVNISQSKKDKTIYMIMDENIVALDRSFSELNLFQEYPADVMWKFVKNLQDRPYETTLTAFSKLSDILLFRPSQTIEHRPEEEVAELLHQSLNSLEGPADADGYEVIASPQPDVLLPPRPVVSRELPITVEEWSLHMDIDGRILEEDQVKKKIFRGGVQPSLRYEVWKFLLGYFPFNSTHVQRQEIRKKKVEEYFQIKLQWKSMTAGQESRFSDFRERKNLIEKDVYRTDRTLPFFEGENNTNVQLLNDILMTYVMYNFDLGYVQGMSDLLSPILYVMENEADAFWCFVGFMDKVCHNFELDQSGMKQQLQQLHNLLHITDPDLSSYLESQDSGNLYFCFRWLLILFKREFSFQDITRLWEVLWTGLPCPNFHLLMCLSVLDTEKNSLIENKYGFTEILKHINDISLQINLDETLAKAEAIYLQLRSASGVPNSVRTIIGLPPVPERSESAEGGDYGVHNPERNMWKVSSPSGDACNHIESVDEDHFEDALNQHYL